MSSNISNSLLWGSSWVFCVFFMQSYDIRETLTGNYHEINVRAVFFEGRLQRPNGMTKMVLWKLFKFKYISTYFLSTSCPYTLTQRSYVYIIYLHIHINASNVWVGNTITLSVICMLLLLLSMIKKISHVFRYCHIFKANQNDFTKIL